MLQLREDRYPERVFWAPSSHDFILYKCVPPSNAVMLKTWQACVHSWLSFSYMADEMMWLLLGKLTVTLTHSIRAGAATGPQADEPGRKQASIYGQMAVCTPSWDGGHDAP